jgi:hypothetical protein
VSVVDVQNVGIPGGMFDCMAAIGSLLLSTQRKAEEASMRKHRAIALIAVVVIATTLTRRSQLSASESPPVAHHVMLTPAENKVGAVSRAGPWDSERDAVWRSE